MLITWVACGAVLAVVLGVVAPLARAARRTRSVTLAAAVAVRGDLLTVHHQPDGPSEVVVVRRVLRDVTRSNVVLIRPWRWWHRWRWTRAWL